MPRVIPRQWVNMQTGELTNEAMLYLDDLENGQTASSPGINRVLAGVNAVTATTDAIIAGTQPLDDVNIAGRGSVSSNLNAISANTNAVAVAASAGALTASVSPSFASGTSAVPATVVTNSVTVTPAGGTGPYTYAWTLAAGDTFTIAAPTAATTTFSKAMGSGEFASAEYRCTVTDSLAAVFAVDVSVTAQITDVL